MPGSLSKRSILLVFLDGGAILAAYVLASLLRSVPVGFVMDHPIFFTAFAVFPFLFYIFDLYYPYKYFGRSQTLIDVLFSVAIAALIMAALSYLDRSFALPRSIFIYAAALIAPFIYLVRLFYDTIFQYRLLDKRTLILGTGPLACEITRIIKETPHPGIEIIGQVYETKKPPSNRKNGIPIVGGMDNLLSLIDWYGIQLVVIAFDPKEEASEMSVLAELLEKRVSVTSAIHLWEQIRGEIPYKLVGAHYLLGLMSQVQRRPYLRLKRMIDVMVGIPLFILLSPVLILAYLCLAMEQGGNPIFYQKRIGYHGRPFQLVKLKTMTDKKGKKDRPKVTAVGRWLRRFRIDEIPQLVNVIKGDMSLIGPRPEIPYFVSRCRKKIPFYDAVFAVKPGLTGWAQVMFRYTTTSKDYDLKFRYNLFYLKNLSLALDFQILLKTIRVVLLGKGR